MDCKYAGLVCDKTNPTSQECQLCLLAEILGELQDLNSDDEEDVEE